ncbi:hypothetical protein OESDEN_10030 [Oesophagostomum dentatum]|uniref:DUF4440 domain-containing protein n=1 Tax=Oesophagostomum dentatum TaxID=61180 RepID=A0A0B1SY03_OESDE|nr:hypothetical protein OESDEN_10030 [Oesophagostomum dentatum]
MKSDECKAILHPMFENFEKQYYAGHLDKSIEENFHTDGVAVHKGVGALYGKKAILEGFSKLSEEYGKVKFARSNENFCGCDCCICASFDVAVESEKKGHVKAKAFQVWKKEGAHWKLYHDEFEILK